MTFYVGFDNLLGNLHLHANIIDENVCSWP